MAVFKEKNGVRKPGGYPCGWMHPPILTARRHFGRALSQQPPFCRISVRRFHSPANAGSVRAAAIPSYGSILKGGANKIKSR